MISSKATYGYRCEQGVVFGGGGVSMTRGYYVVKNYYRRNAVSMDHIAHTMPHSVGAITQAAVHSSCLPLTRTSTW